jgi:hypothetical protein
MVNSFFASQEVTISDLEVGFNDLPKVPLDFIRFGDVKANIQSVTTRVDLWILPFVDLYFIGGKTWTQTNVNITDPLNFTTKAKFDGSTLGFGATVAGGYHGIVLIMDINHTWTKIPEIEGAIETTLFTPRLGYNFLSNKRPWQNIVIWVGAPRIYLNRLTEGTISVSDITGSPQRSELDGIVNETPGWYQSLQPGQKQVVNAIARKMRDKIDGNDLGEATISYSLKKRPKSDWSMCVGGQFQLDHHWQFRAEVGFIGRKSVLASANYRLRW